MIYDTLDHISHYQNLHPRLFQGLRFLAETDFSTAGWERYEIDGSNIFAMLQDYETRTANPTPEAHKKYLDIQYMVQGQELVDTAPLAAMTEVVESRPERDIWFYHGPCDRLSLKENRFMVFYPQDAHAPCIADGNPSKVRKCVVKVLLDD